MLHLLQRNKDDFLSMWEKNILSHQKSLDLREEFSLSRLDLEMLIECFQEDISFHTSQKTFLTLKSMIEKSSPDSSFLFKAELVNITFKETAREIFRLDPLLTQEDRTQVMSAIGKIVDQIDLRLSLEYEKIVTRGMERAQENERLNTKSAVLTTLQHEIRQPLSYIFNSAELLLSGAYDDESDLMLQTILEQSREIEGLLSKLEKANNINLRPYSQDINMLDLPGEQGEK